MTADTLFNNLRPTALALIISEVLHGCEVDSMDDLFEIYGEEEAYVIIVRKAYRELVRNAGKQMAENYIEHAMQISDGAYTLHNDIDSDTEE